MILESIILGMIAGAYVVNSTQKDLPEESKLKNYSFWFVMEWVGFSFFFFVIAIIAFLIIK